MNVDTTYKYYKVGTYFDSLRTETDSTSVYYYFHNEASMIRGEQESAISLIFIPFLDEYYGMNITYDIDFFSSTGTILIYD